MTYPFTVYRVEEMRYSQDRRLPPEELACKGCGKKCGHTTGVVRIKTEIVTFHRVQEYKVIGSNDKEYFVEVEYNDDGDKRTTIEKILMTEVFHHKAHAEDVAAYKDDQLKESS